jgi:flavorubredoxin/flavin reductase (DIM6/NTAB) family NADH-FMN oxidoreductase RutF
LRINIMSAEVLNPSSNPSSRPRDVQTATIGTDTTVLRSRTWDRLKFEVEYAQQRGTTANSYLIRADQIALIDPPGESFTTPYLEQLQYPVALANIDYIVLSHVNSNRLATLKPLLMRAPNAIVVTSRPGENALQAAFPDGSIPIKTVRSGETLDLGQGHCLEFLTVPTPRWPDGLVTYDPATQILFSDKLFGVHVCGDDLFDEQWKSLDGDRRYYFDCLHAPQAKQVEAALEKLERFNPTSLAPAHGAIVRYSVSRVQFDYRQWCQAQGSQEFRVALLYASAYGNTATMAQAIAQGLVDSGITVESINCEHADPEQISRALEVCDGFMIGSPTLGGHAPIQIQSVLGTVITTAAKTKLAGVFGSYGWSGEAVDLLEQRLLDGGYHFGFETLRVQFNPDAAALKACHTAGETFAQALKKSKKLRTPRQIEVQSDRTAQAVGRVIGSLCVVTSAPGQVHQGFLSSSVSQATFSPPGIMLSLTREEEDAANLQVGDAFVLNILKEGRNLRRHFQGGAVSGLDQYAPIQTDTAVNGCLILREALAYLECTIRDRIEAGDRWLIYAVVEQGHLLETTGVTAIQHRKSAA